MASEWWIVLNSVNIATIFTYSLNSQVIFILSSEQSVWSSSEQTTGWLADSSWRADKIKWRERPSSSEEKLKWSAKRERERERTRGNCSSWKGNICSNSGIIASNLRQEQRACGGKQLRAHTMSKRQDEAKRDESSQVETQWDNGTTRDDMRRDEAKRNELKRNEKLNEN